MTLAEFIPSVSSKVGGYPTLEELYDWGTHHKWAVLVNGRHLRMLLVQAH